MQVLKPMLKTQVHCAFGALKVFNISQLSLAPLRLTVCRAPLWPRCLLRIPLIQLELALSSFNVLVPDMLLRDPLLGLPFEAQTRLANRTQNHVIVVDRVKRFAFAFVVIGSAMVCAVYLSAIFTFERQKVLLRAVLHGAVGAYVCEFHYI